MARNSNTPNSNPDDAPVQPMTRLSGMLDDALSGHTPYGEKPPEERLSRAQESRAGDVVHDAYDDIWEPTGLLDTKHLPARPGFAQRWVRTKLNGVDDPKNVMKRMNQGYRPRMASTVPAGVYAPTIESKNGEVIGMDGIVLMERPEHMHAKHVAHNRHMANRQMDAVNQMLARTQDGSRGFGPVRIDTRSDVSTGQRPAPVADD